MSSFLIFFSLSFVLVDICEHLLLRDFASLIDLFFFFEKVFVHCVDLKVCTGKEPFKNANLKSVEKVHT